MDKRIQRIESMEKSFCRAKKAAKELEKALDNYTRAAEDILLLYRYYGSSDWKSDFEADEKGELPKDLKRGVLSEDGLYDFLEDTRELARIMAELAERLSEV